jgi:heat shock protein HtpX
MSKNAIKTVLLLGGLTGLLLAGGELLGGRQGLIIGLVISILTSGISYFFAEKIALATYSAQPVTETENVEAYRRVAPMVRNLAMRMNIPMPKLWLIPDDSPNAFATGRNPNHSSLAFTAGILNLMSDNELEGVVAHELGHVLHRDILISSVAAMIAGAITFAARMAFWFGGSRDDEDRGGSPIAAIAMMILAPIAALLIQMAISRSREYDADAASAKYVGSPYPLIGGLQKLETYSKRIPMDATPSTAHMFIIKPFTGQSIMRLFSTHPSTEDRIARLQATR